MEAAVGTEGWRLRAGVANRSAMIEVSPHRNNAGSGYTVGEDVGHSRVSMQAQHAG